MKRDKSTISMTVVEAKGLLVEISGDGGADKIIELKKLAEAQIPRKKYKVSHRFRLSEQEQIRLLRVDAEVAAKQNAESLILAAWAETRHAIASIAELWAMCGEKLNAIEGLKSPPAWVKHTVQQALLRGDAEKVMVGQQAENSDEAEAA